MKKYSKKSDSPQSGELSNQNAPASEVSISPQNVKQSNLPTTSEDLLNSLLNEFGQAWLYCKSSMTSFLAKAGPLVCRIVDTAWCGEGYEPILRRYPDLTAKFLSIVEAVGRGQLLPELAIEPCYAAKLLGKLPIELQRKYLATPLPVVTRNTRGETERTMKSLQEMSVAEANRAISHTQNKVLTHDEQEELIKKPCLPPIVEPFEVTEQNHIVFHREGPWQLAELEAIIDSVKRKIISTLEPTLKKRQIA